MWFRIFWPEDRKTASVRGVVYLADARVRLRPKHPSEASLVEELDDVRSLLDQDFPLKLALVLLR